MIKVGVVGYGYWGPNLVRNFLAIPDATVATVCDLKEDNLRKARMAFPSVSTTSDFDALISDPEIDLVIIATPVSTHFPLALSALKANKHVLVEKPLATNSEQGRLLIQEARERNRVLAVDHTFVYTGAVRKIRSMIDNGDLGEITYYDSTRVNLGLFQHDVSVLWDLAVHDLSILHYLLPTRPVAVSATGISHYGTSVENIAFMTLFFEGSLIAHINVNWLSPVKIRQTLIGGTRKMVVYDDLEPAEKIKIYDKGVVVTDDPEKIAQLQIGYRTGDMLAPKLDITEALRTEAEHLVDCIRSGQRPICDGDAGLAVLYILEAASESMRQRGQTVPISAAVP